jgi:hypothetical protein
VTSPGHYRTDGRHRVRLAGTRKTSNGPTSTWKVGTPPPEGRKTIRRPSFTLGWSTPAWYRITNPGPEKTGTKVPEFPKPELVPFSCSTITASSESLIFIKSTVVFGSHHDPKLTTPPCPLPGKPCLGNLACRDRVLAERDRESLDTGRPHRSSHARPSRGHGRDD